MTALGVVVLVLVLVVLYALGFMGRWGLLGVWLAMRWPPHAHGADWAAFLQTSVDDAFLGVVQRHHKGVCIIVASRFFGRWDTHPVLVRLSATRPAELLFMGVAFAMWPYWFYIMAYIAERKLHRMWERRWQVQ